MSEKNGSNRIEAHGLEVIHGDDEHDDAPLQCSICHRVIERDEWYQAIELTNQRVNQDGSITIEDDSDRELALVCAVDYRHQDHNHKAPTKADDLADRVDEMVQYAAHEYEMAEQDTGRLPGWVVNVILTLAFALAAVPVALKVLAWALLIPAKTVTLLGMVLDGNKASTAALELFAFDGTLDPFTRS